MKNILLPNSIMMLFGYLLGAADPCVPDPCNQNGATGEVCNAGNCNCGAAPCAGGQVCNNGVCGMYLKPNIPYNNINISSLGYVTFHCFY